MTYRAQTGLRSRVVCGILVLLLASASNANQDRVKREMIQTLEAYAVYKMAQFEDAFDKFKSLAERGNLQGMLNIANMYQAGEGVEKNPTLALEWYLKGSERGDPRAMFNVAQAYEQGLGVISDHDIALKYYHLAAQEGSDAARAYLIDNGLADAATFPQTTLIHDANTEPVQAGDTIMIQEFLQELDDITNKMDAAGIVDALIDNPTILVRLPGAAESQSLSRDELQAFWQKTFDQIERYRFNRLHVTLSKHPDGIVIQSKIREYLTTTERTQVLEILELMQVDVSGPQISVSRLDIQLNSVN